MHFTLYKSSCNSRCRPFTSTTLEAVLTGRNRIVAASAEGMAAQYPASSEPHSTQHPVATERLDSELTATGFESTEWREPRRDPSLVSPDDRDQHRYDDPPARGLTTISCAWRSTAQGELSATRTPIRVRTCSARSLKGIELQPGLGMKMISRTVGSSWR